MNKFNPKAYGPVFAALLATDRRRPLNAGKCDGSFRAELEGFSADAAFDHAKIADDGMAECCVAGVWLLHDCLEESHTISQGIDTPTGSFWHAIMHRREGDFSNAKYWFRNVGRHEAFDAIGRRAGELLAAHGAEQASKKLLGGGAWDPFALVDACESVVRGRAGDAALCLDIQQAEWEELFDYCYRKALGTQGATRSAPCGPAPISDT
jgi:hypothetical protein